MDSKLISNYLSYCKTHKRLSTHTIRAYKNDLLQFYNSHYNNVESYIEFLTISYIKSNRTPKGTYSVVFTTMFVWIYIIICLLVGLLGLQRL